MFRSLRSIITKEASGIRAFSTAAANAATPAQSASTTTTTAATKAAPKPKQLTWRVTRTDSKNLPVYVETLANKQSYTVVRKIEGDRNALVSHLRSFVGSEPQIKVYEGNKVSVSGKRAVQIKQWLQKLGM